MGGNSSTLLATMPRQSLSISAGAITASSGGGSQASNSQDYFQAMSLNQSQVEKDLVQRPDDPVTEQGLYARLQNFGNYNELGDQKGLREVMGGQMAPGSGRVASLEGSRFRMTHRKILSSVFFWTRHFSFLRLLERAFVEKNCMPRKLSLDHLLLLCAVVVAISTHHTTPSQHHNNDARHDSHGWLFLLLFFRYGIV